MFFVLRHHFVPRHFYPEVRRKNPESRRKKAELGGILFETFFCTEQHDKTIQKSISLGIFFGPRRLFWESAEINAYRQVRKLHHPKHWSKEQRRSAEGFITRSYNHSLQISIIALAKQDLFWHFLESSSIDFIFSLRKPIFSKTKLFRDLFGWICSGSYNLSREIKSGTPRFMVGSHLQPPSQRAPHVEWPRGDQKSWTLPLGLTPRPKERSVVVFRRELSNFGRNMWLLCLCFCVMSGWLPYASCRRSQFWEYQSSGHISGPFLLVRCPWPSINIHQHWNFTPWPKQAQTSNLPKAPMSIAPPVPAANSTVHRTMESPSSQRRGSPMLDTPGAAGLTKCVALADENYQWRFPDGGYPFTLW